MHHLANPENPINQGSDEGDQQMNFIVQPDIACVP